MEPRDQGNKKTAWGRQKKNQNPRKKQKTPKGNAKERRVGRVTRVWFIGGAGGWGGGTKKRPKTKQ